MATVRRLQQAPIKEALVDLRILPSRPIDAETLAPLRERLSQTFPAVQERKGLQTKFRIEGGQIGTSDTKDLGFQGLFFKAKDQAAMAQFRPDGFTLNRLHNYTSADDLLAEAMDLWSTYVALTQPAKVIRLALRYINRLQLPFGHGDSFEKFLTAAPTMPQGTPQSLATFLTRVVVIDESVHATAIVTQKLEHSTAKPTPFILDIDAYKTGEFDTGADRLLPIFQELRVLKNTLFFGFLTEEAVEIYA